MQRVAMRASGTPVAFSRNGTVREARGLISITWMTPRWLANWMFSSPTTPRARARRRVNTCMSAISEAFVLYGGSTAKLSPLWMPHSSMCCMMPPISTSLAVAYGVDVEFDGILQELVDQHRVLAADDGCGGEPLAQLRLVVDHAHGATAEHVARAAPSPGSPVRAATAQAVVRGRARCPSAGRGNVQVVPAGGRSGRGPRRGRSLRRRCPAARRRPRAGRAPGSAASGRRG